MSGTVNEVTSGYLLHFWVHQYPTWPSSTPDHLTGICRVPPTSGSPLRTAPGDENLSRPSSYPLSIPLRGPGQLPDRVPGRLALHRKGLHVISSTASAGITYIITWRTGPTQPVQGPVWWAGRQLCIGSWSGPPAL